MRRSLVFIATTLTLLLLTGPARSAGETARYRMMYVLPLTPSIDVYVGVEAASGEPTFPGVAFAEPTAYITVPAGDYGVQGTIAGTDEMVLDTGVGLPAGTVSSFIVLGFFPVLQGLPVFEDPAVDPAVARVRFMHLAQGDGPMDITIDGGPMLAENVKFSDAGAPVDVVPGKYDLHVRLAETGTLVLTSLGISFEPGHLYSFAAFGSSAETTLTAVTLLDNTVEPDVNGDGAVNVDDLVQVILDWGPCDAGPGLCVSDATDDAAIDGDDLEAVLLNFDP